MPKSKRRNRSKTSKSGYIGVIKIPSGKYRAQIKIDGTMKYFGSSYDTAKKAAKAYDKEVIKLRRPLSKLNYPKKAPVGYTPIQQTLRSNNTVGYRGVRKASRGKKFEASILIGGKQQHLGTYETAKEAAIAWDRAVLKANQCTTLLNFPDMVHNLDVEPKYKVRSNNTTGYKGVSKHKDAFMVQIRIAGRKQYFYGFDTAISAALAYDQAAIKNGNKSKTLNFPDGLPIKQESDIDESEGFWV